MLSGCFAFWGVLGGGGLGVVVGLWFLGGGVVWWGVWVVLGGVVWVNYFTGCVFPPPKFRPTLSRIAARPLASFFHHLSDKEHQFLSIPTACVRGFFGSGILTGAAWFLFLSPPVRLLSSVGWEMPPFPLASIGPPIVCGVLFSAVPLYRKRPVVFHPKIRKPDYAPRLLCLPPVYPLPFRRPPPCFLRRGARPLFSPTTDCFLSSRNSTTCVRWNAWSPPNCRPAAPPLSRNF